MAITSVMPMSMTLPMIVTGTMAVDLLGRHWPVTLLHGRRQVADTAFDDLVQFAAIEPDPTALGTIINLNSLPFAHDEIHTTCGAMKPLCHTGIRYITHSLIPVSTGAVSSP